MARKSREYVNIVNTQPAIKWADADKLVTGAIDVDLT
jgi:hypothetical protein